MKKVLLVVGLVVSISGFAQSVSGSLGDKLAAITPLKDGRFEIWTSCYSEGVRKDTVDTFPTNFKPMKKTYSTSSPNYGQVVQVTKGNWGSIIVYKSGNTYRHIANIGGQESITTTTFYY
jgi:hypothetical protein